MLFFSAATATKSTAEPYLSTLSQGELEKLGLKAVAAGANPQQLQQAFATAQLQGDWSKLEKLIADVLGIEAINSPQVGLAAVASQLLTGASGATSSSTRPGQSQVSSSVTTTQDEGTGIVAQASNFIKRIGKKFSISTFYLNSIFQKINFSSISTFIFKFIYFTKQLFSKFIFF